MIRRTLMRRAYNGGRWAQARAIANKLLNIPKEQELARSVIIRSLYNEGKFDELIELNDQWENRFDYLLENMNNSQSKSSADISRLQRILLDQPQPKTEFEFDEQSTANNFFQENNRVWMRHPHGYTYWDMPEAYSLQQTHPDLLRLVAEILLYPWYPSTRVELEGTRVKGSQISLSFSAGIDSTAAMLVMPESTI